MDRVNYSPVDCGPGKVALAEEEWLGSASASFAASASKASAEGFILRFSLVAMFLRSMQIAWPAILRRDLIQSVELHLL
jgi:hypothetical protein